MSAGAPALAFWGQLSPQWRTATTTTGAAHRNSEVHERGESPLNLVYILAPQPQSGFTARADTPQYRAPASSRLFPRIFILESPASSFPARLMDSAATAAQVDSNVGTGVIAINASRTVLFSKTMEIRTEDLRRLKPRIHIDPTASEREDA